MLGKGGLKAASRAHISSRPSSVVSVDGSHLSAAIGSDAPPPHAAAEFRSALSHYVEDEWACFVVSGRRATGRSAGKFAAVLIHRLQLGVPPSNDARTVTRSQRRCPRGNAEV